jgi:hypothetical protein
MDGRLTGLLRAAGAILALVITVTLGALLVALRTNGGTVLFGPDVRNAPMDVGGQVEFYGHGTIVLTTSTNGLREVSVDGRTVVEEPAAGLTSLAALRPGRNVAVWGDPARHIFVWGETR